MNKNKLTLKDKLKSAISQAMGIPLIVDLAAYRNTVVLIREAEASYTVDQNLADEAARLRGLLADAPDQKESLRIRFFALVLQAFKSKLGVDIFDEQLLAALVMADGGLAEMATGEGKTFAAVFAAAWWALEGRGVHVLTANDYLAGRDAAWLRPVYESLGLHVASVGETMDSAARRKAYAADITYVPARESGYDYLRDRLAMRLEDLVQRPLHAVIVDEADSILIDEARIPLVIAEANALSQDWLGRYDRLADALIPGEHYNVDSDRLVVSLSDRGQDFVARELGIDGMHRPEDRDHFARMHAALYARCFLKKDVDYVVQDGQAQIVDAFTGRKANGRRWPYGVQAAVETRERMVVQPESTILGSISMQRYIPLFTRLAAMTATAAPAAAELFNAYGLPIFVIPPHLPVRRIDAPDLLYRTKSAKEDAIIAEILAEHQTGRPILVATASVAESEALADKLRARGISPFVLNAKNDASEAQAIASAGILGAVTVSTDMAGRGTDIRLGGPDGGDEERRQLFELGGLYVLGTSRRESRRLDNQLRGRAGRQGEPGFSRFFTSLEDSLFTRYGVKEFLPRELRESLGLEQADASPIEHPKVRAEIDRAQRIMEGHNHDARDALREKTKLLELHRRRIAFMREEALLEQPVSRAYLKAIDRFWASHLAFAEDLREGVHLFSYGGRNPEKEYNKLLDDEFEAALSNVEHDALELLDDALAQPSATWTYQIDEQSPGGFKLPSGMGGAMIAESFIMLPLTILRSVMQIFGKKTSKVVRP